MLKVAFIGSGVMAEAMIKGTLAHQLLKPADISCADPLPKRVADLAERYGVRASTDNAEVVPGADVVVMSIKPQMLHEVTAKLQGKLTPNQLVLSIMAGITTQQLVDGLGVPAVVRVMPNTPAQIGMGMSVWCATEAVTPEQRDRARQVLSALGKELYVTHELQLDMATALSGSGPAFVFLFMEALVDAGVHMGFNRQVAKDLVIQTVKGSAEFAEQSPEHFAHLRNMVTSPGGTTADAIYQLEKGGLRTIISKAVHSAFQKSIYLSRQEG